MNQLISTHAYDKFEFLIFNRDVKKTKYLEESMKVHGFIPAYPLHCVKTINNKLKIKAGHHRFYVARKLKLPVWYVVSEDDASIFELEVATNKWSIADYLAAHAREGKNNDYLRLLQYCEETGIGIQNALSMLGGHSAGSGNFQKEFKNGSYHIRVNQDHAETVKDIVLHAKESGIYFYNHSLFVQAVSKIVWVDDFSVSRFKSKITTFAGLVEKKATLHQYLEHFEDIYNRQSRNKVPLAFQAIEKAKSRNAVKAGR
jgi:hypothetical protein